MKRKVLFMSLGVLIFAILLAISSFAAIDYNEKAVLADKTVLPIYDENQNPLIWYVSGIDANYTDLNICYINYPALIADLGYNKDTDTQEREKGDINADGKINSNDARTALRASAKLVTLKGNAKIAADMDDDGNVSASDARKILRISAKLE